MKKLASLGISILLVACAAAPDDTQPPPSTETEEAPSSEPSEEEVATQSQAASSNCRWTTMGCCNFGRNAQRAWQCFYAGSWHTSSRRCASELRCAL